MPFLDQKIGIVQLCWHMTLYGLPDQYMKVNKPGRLISRVYNILYIFITFWICDTQFACNAAAAKSSSLCLDMGEIKLRW